jgi:hypothetical protein
MPTEGNNNNPHQQQVLVSTSEDGHVRLWEAKGQALTVAQQSASVGCALLCSCVTQNVYNVNNNSNSNNKQPVMLFAGSQAGILFGWNLQQAPVNNNNDPSSSSSSSSTSPSIHNQAPSMRVLVNRYPISAIACVTDWYDKGQNGMLVASTTRGVVMTFWFDVDAVCTKGALSTSHQQHNINKHKQQILASATNNNNININNNNQQQQQQDKFNDRQSALSSGTGFNQNLNNNATNNQKDKNNNNNTSEALFRGGGENTTNNNGPSTSDASHVFDGNAVPINHVAIPPSIFTFASIFRAHNKYIVKNTFSPSCYLQNPNNNNNGSANLFLLATASADCTAKLWRVPSAWAAFNSPQHAAQMQHVSEVLAAIATSDDINIGILTGEQSITRALNNAAASSAVVTSSSSSSATTNNNNSTEINNNNNSSTKPTTTSTSTSTSVGAVSAAVDKNSVAAMCQWNLDCTIPHQRWVWDIAFSARNAMAPTSSNNTTNSQHTTTILTLFTASSENAAWSWNITFSNKQPAASSNNTTSNNSTTNNNQQQPTSVQTSAETKKSTLPLIVTSMAKTFQYTGHQKPVTCLGLYEKNMW